MAKKHEHEDRQEGDDERVQRIRDIIDPLLRRFGISQQYHINVYFADRMRTHKALGKARNVTARVSDEWPYRTFTIELCREFLDGYDDWSLRKTLIHEVLHVVVFGGMRRYIESKSGIDFEEGDVDVFYEVIEENAVDLLAIWINRLYGDWEALAQEKQTREKQVEEKKARRVKKGARPRSQ